MDGRTVNVGILWPFVDSFTNVVKDICKVNQWKCNITSGGPFAPYTLIGTFDLFMGSSTDFQFSVVDSKVYYISVEGNINPIYKPKLKTICRRKYCISATKWGAKIFEQHDIPVADVIYHALPLPVPNTTPKVDRTYNAIYLNAAYFVLRGGEIIERKGWKLWPIIADAIPNSYGFTKSNFSSLPKYYKYDADYSAVEKKVVKYSSMSLSEIYSLYENAKVFTNLSYNDGFGLNPLMALAVGTNLVAWDFPVFRELYEGIDGAYLVPAEKQFECMILSAPKLSLYCVEGDAEKYVATVKRVLDNWRLADWQTVRQKFDPYRLYSKFSEFLTSSPP